jgi:hypothetical protein
MERPFFHDPAIESRIGTADRTPFRKAIQQKWFGTPERNARAGCTDGVQCAFLQTSFPSWKVGHVLSKILFIFRQHMADEMKFENVAKLNRYCLK